MFIHAPIASTYVESWIGNLKRECLNDFLCFSLRHIDHIAQAYVRYYNQLRPHQSMDNVSLSTPGQPQPQAVIGPIQHHQMLEGLLNHYERKNCINHKETSGERQFKPSSEMNPIITSVPASRSAWRLRRPGQVRTRHRSHMQLLIRLVTLMLFLIPTVALADAGDGGDGSLMDTDIRDRCVNILRQGLEVKDFWPRMHAAEALTSLGYTREVRARLQLDLADTIDPQQKVGLARELLRSGNEQAMREIVEALRNPGSTAQVHAAESLFKLGRVGDREALKAAANQQADRSLRVYATGAIARLAEDPSPQLATLIQLLGNEDETPRIQAAYVLGQLGERSAVPALIDRLARTDRISVEYDMILLALMNLGDQRGIDMAESLVANENVAIRSLFAEALARLHHPGRQSFLMKLLEDPNLDVRIRAAHSLLASSR